MTRAAVIADRAVVALALVALVVLSLRTIATPDLWWQLATGDWVLHHGFPTTDPFSYWASGREWIELRWLWCVALHLAFRGLGPAWLTVGTTILLAGVGALLVRAAGRGAAWAGAAGVVVFLATAHTRFVVRPEIFTFVALAAELALLRRWRGTLDGRLLVALPILQLVWVNTHTLFVLGPVVAWTFVGAEGIGGTFLARAFDPGVRLDPRSLRAPALAAVGMTLACFVNPWTWHGALFPIRLLTEIGSDNPLKVAIQEFRSPWALGLASPFVLAWLGGIVVCLAVLVASGRRTRPSAWAFFVAFALVSSLAIRNVALFGLVGGWLVAEGLGSFPRIAWSVRILVATALVVAIPAVASGGYYRKNDPEVRFGLGVSRVFPARALAFARAEGLPMPVIHALGDGGYVLFEGGPGSVLVDGRLEVYGGETISRSGPLWSRGEGIDDVAARHGAHTALVRYGKEVGFFGALFGRRDWVPVYFDSSHALFVHRTEATRALVERLAIDWRSPKRIPAPPLPSWYPGDDVPLDAREEDALGKLFIVVRNLGEARLHFERSLALEPEGEVANLHMGLILRAAGDEPGAEARFRFVRRELLDRPDVQRLEGNLGEMAGHPDRALRAYQRVTASGETSAAAWQDVARAALAAGDAKETRTALEAIVRVRPDEADGWNNLGVFLERQGDVEGALRNFERSLGIAARQPAVLNEVGTLRLARGDVAGARDAFLRALDVDPSFEPARANLAGLR